MRPGLPDDKKRELKRRRFNIYYNTTVKFFQVFLQKITKLLYFAYTAFPFPFFLCIDN